jgi:solute carrier family 25 carnitine/acylcarnitine transporter 20/29
MKVRLQTQDPHNPTYSGLGDCMKKTFQSEGAAGFYKGFQSPLYGQMFFNAIQFMAYGKAKEMATILLPNNDNSQPNNQMTIPQYFLAGAITGSVVAFVESPIDLMKTQLQTQVFAEKPAFSTFFGTVKYISGNFGVRGIYQGLAPTIVRNIPAVSFYFGAYEWGRRKLCDHSKGETVDSLPSYKLLAAGALGGFAYWMFVYPIDVVKSSMQSDSPLRSSRKYQGTLDAISKMYSSGGIKRFFVGLSPCLIRAAPANGVCFMLYQKTVELLDNYAKGK